MFSKEMNFFKLDIRMVTSVRFVSFFSYVKENREKRIIDSLSESYKNSSYVLFLNNWIIEI